MLSVALQRLWIRLRGLNFKQRDREQIPAEIDLKIETALQTSDASGEHVRLLVVELDEKTVTLDANHPLAGKALTFGLELVGFVP